MKTVFDQVKENHAFLPDLYPFDLAVYAVIDDVTTGYRVAAYYSPQIHMKFNLNAWEHYTPIRPYGIDAFDKKPLPQQTVFLYPERTLAPLQEQNFMNTIAERRDLKQVLVITTSPLILTDVTEAYVFVARGDQGWPEMTVEKRLFAM